MKTIETTAVIGEDRLLHIQLPLDITPGTHRVAVVIDEPVANSKSLDDFPTIDVGPWPDELSLSREDMYGTDGR